MPIGEYAPEVLVLDATMVGSQADLAGLEGGLQVIDSSAPVRQTLTASAPTGDYARDIQMSRTTLHATDQNSGYGRFSLDSVGSSAPLRSASGGSGVSAQAIAAWGPRAPANGWDNPPSDQASLAPGKPRDHPKPGFALRVPCAQTPPIHCP